MTRLHGATLMKRTSRPATRADQLMMVAAVIDGLRRDTRGLVDDDTLTHYQRLSDSLRRCAFSGATAGRGRA